MRPSRRAFLTGARNLADPWARFCQRLRRCVHGALEEWEPDSTGAARARLRLAREEDVLHARALCVESGVVMALDGCPMPPYQRVLIVDPGNLDSVVAQDDGSVVAEAGASLSDIRRYVPAACSSGSDSATLAQWLAGCAGSAPGSQPDISCLESIDVLLASGEIESFGPFGAQTQRPPLGSGARAIVSQLFLLVNSGELRPWRQLDVWPARYRLNTLWEHEPNLAHIWPGSQGTLGWLLRAQFRSPHTPAAQGADRSANPAAEVGGASPGAAHAVPLYGQAPTGVAVGLTAAAVHEFEDDVKQAFDPHGLFPRLPLFPVV